MKRLPFKRITLLTVTIGTLYLLLFDQTPRGTECQKSTSPDRSYIAERCLLNWIPGGNSEYVGRVSDAETGKVLVQRSFSTPVPETLWFESGNMTFSRGGPRCLCHLSVLGMG